MQKAIGELLLADYTRKGFIDGRALRLPTISVRPGRPNAAASSFASGIIREPLNSEPGVCPVGPRRGDVAGFARHRDREPDRRPRAALRVARELQVDQCGGDFSDRRRDGRLARARRRARRCPRECDGSPMPGSNGWSAAGPAPATTPAPARSACRSTKTWTRSSGSTWRIGAL